MNTISLPRDWVCDGSTLKPKSGARLDNTWIFDGKELKPKSGARFNNTYDMGEEPILVVFGQLILHLW